MPSRPLTLRLADDAVTPGASDQRVALVGVVEDLVALLVAQFPSGGEFPADALRTRLNQSRDRLRSSDHAEDVAEAGLRLIGDASQAYARLSGHVSAREAEFTGIIRLLRELVDGLRGDAMAFRNDLMASSARVADLTQIEDIRTLRRALNREVDQLRQCVQRGEHQETSRLARVAGDLQKVDETMAHTGETRDSGVGLLPRPALLADIAGAPSGPAALVICRIDEPEAIVDGHGASVLERVVVALAQLLKGTFGNDTRVYRSSTHSVAMFLPRAQTRQVAQLVKKVQARVAPEYEYERHGVTRRVVFTFSGVVTHSPGKTEADGPDALARAEKQVVEMGGLSQIEAEASGIGRLVNWLSSAG
jgi:GGDEF domain-containing protein